MPNHVEISAAPAHRLNTDSGFINPLWLNRVRHRAMEAVVEADGTLLVDGERLCFVEAPLPAGTRVRVTLGRWFTCVAEADWARERAQAEAAAAQREAKRRADLNRLRTDAEAFNARLQLPRRWVPAIKDVLSGLSEQSMGDGRNRATVQHILLLEDLQAGRLSRRAGDFLCTNAAGSNGKRWSTPEISAYDGDGRRFAPKITCKRCLELAARWTTA